MRKIHLKSYSKINLFLKVSKKLKNQNLHNIQSLVFLTNLSDDIFIKKSEKKKDIITFKGRFCNYVNKDINSVNKSIYLLKKKGLIKKNNFYKIVIKKNIPVFSGMGGGSSNAATIIKFFLKRKISNQNLNHFSQTLGSDLKLFFHSNHIFQKNLNNFQNIKKKNFYFLIVYPFLKCSTKEIYSKVRNYKILKKKNNFNFNSKVKMVQFLKNKKNSLEKIVLSKFPKIKKILNEIGKINNCQFSRVTGSGSACFGLFLTKKSADIGLKKIKKKFPKYWCVTGRTI